VNHRRRALRAAAALGTCALALGGRAARAQRTDSVRVVDAGPGVSGRLLRDALAAPHLTLFADSTLVALPRDSVIPTTVVILGGSATVASAVRGDVIVVDGDLFLHPGAEISGRAVAIGGCVYNSTLATVAGGHLCFRENTFVVRRTPGGETTLAYRSLRVGRPSGLSLSGIAGFQLPSYDRVNGLSLPWGPTLAIDTGRVEIDPRITYRSDLGVIDPSLAVRMQLGRRTTAAVAAARGTFTNDAWIRSDIINALGAFATGADTRNYYRADRADARLTRAFEGKSGTTSFFVGALTEKARSVGPDSGATSAPYSVFGRRDSVNGMLRPNPQGTEGRITSAVAGASRTVTLGDLSADAVVTAEVPVEAPGDSRFYQVTLDASTTFATFGSHRFGAAAHALLTGGDPTPRQRFGYLGGAGTLPTESMLQFGGDRVLYVEGLYTVPFERIRVPFVGSPAVGLRYVAGSAGVRELPDFTQNVGVRLSLGFLRADFMVNPATRRSDLGLGISFSR
jgi:hypothetical protein